MPHQPPPHSLPDPPPPHLPHLQATTHRPRRQNRPIRGQCHARDRVFKVLYLNCFARVDRGEADGAVPVAAADERAVIGEGEAGGEGENADVKGGLEMTTEIGVTC